jgi:hypothetical protein
MSNTGGSAPPIFAKGAKFDSENWVTWSSLVKITAGLRGVYRYLDGSIINLATNPQNIPLPSTPPTTSTSPSSVPVTSPQTTTKSPWESLTPSTSEWKVWNAWTMGLLIYNTSNPVGLG